MRARSLAGAGVLVALGSCGVSAGTAEFVKGSAVDVFTLRQGTISELRSRRGAGPFREYALPPEDVLDAAEGVLKTRVAAVFVNRRALEVLAKERSGEDAYDEYYAPEWDAAAVVIVHRVPGEPSRSRVEVHATRRGVFVGGRIDWERVVPPLLDAAVAARLRGLRPVRR